MAEDAPYHAHVYYSAGERPEAEALHDRFARLACSGDYSPVLFVGRMMDGGVGPHPVAQFEVHFRAHSFHRVVTVIEATGLRALVHPPTDDDLADHTTHGRWIGEPLELDLTVLDPPGRNQGVERFGKSDF